MQERTLSRQNTRLLGPPTHLLGSCPGPVMQSLVHEQNGLRVSHISATVQERLGGTSTRIYTPQSPHTD
jgi:hypothetical protein